MLCQAQRAAAVPDAAAVARLIGGHLPRSHPRPAAAKFARSSRRAHTLVMAAAVTDEASAVPAPPSPPRSNNPVVIKMREALEFCSAAAGSTLTGELAKNVKDAVVIEAQAAGDATPTTAHVWWLPGSATLAIAFKASDELEKMDDDNDPALAKTTVPFYLARPPLHNVASWDTKAQVSAPVAERLQALDPELVRAMKRLVPDGDLRNRVRRVLVTGYGAGGTLAKVAAPWLALLAMEADVRAITFDAFGAGNAEFARVFDWLVGVAFRDDDQQDDTSGLIRLGEPMALPFDLPNKKDKGPRPAALEVELSEALRDDEDNALLLNDEGRQKLEQEDAAPAGLFNTYAQSFYVAAMANARPADESIALGELDVENVAVPPSYCASLDGYIEGITLARMQPLSILSSAAYAEQKEFRERTGLSNAVLVEHKPTDSQVYVAWLENGDLGATGGTVILAFRGTSSKQDALIDARAWRDELEINQDAIAGWVHSGFLKQLDKLVTAADGGQTIPRVVDELRGDRNVDRVICTGHSLGAALATLGAGWAALQYPAADVRCFSFASPHVGDRDATKSFRRLVGMHCRSVYRADVVPRLLTFSKYRHVDPVIRLHGRGQVEMPWNNKPYLNVFHKWWQGVADHNMDNYTESVRFKP